MNVSAISRQSFYPLHACGDDSISDEEEVEAREWRVQRLASLLPEYLDAPMERIIALARCVIFELPKLVESGKTELLWREYDLPCTVRSDQVTRAHFFFLKHQVATEGTYRRAKTVLCLLPNNDALIRAKKVVPRVMTPGDLEHQEYDLRIFSDPRLKDAKGLPKMHAMISYPWRHQESVEKPCFMMEYFDGELSVLVTKIQDRKVVPPSFRELVSIVQQMVEGVFALHTHVNEQGKLDPIGHYDIKPQNFLFRIDRIGQNARKFVVALCDFGLHCHVRMSPDKDDVRQWYIASNHLYPYKAGTAPELLSEKKALAHNDDCLKADIWALGFVSLQLVRALQLGTPIDENAEWVNELEKDTKNFSAALDIARKALLCERDRRLDAVRKASNGELNPLIDIIAMMLKSNTGKRAHVRTVKKKIERLATKLG